MNGPARIWGIALVAALAGCVAAGRYGRREVPPAVLVRDAPPVYFRGANRTHLDQAGETDCNSPAHWDGNTFYVFNSAGHPWRSGGTDLFHLTNDSRRT